MSNSAAVAAEALPDGRRAAFKKIHGAVRQSRALSRAGLSEQLFAHVFSGLVYAQIWEDPEVDMVAMQLGNGHRVVTIASAAAMRFPISSPIPRASRRWT